MSSYALRAAAKGGRNDAVNRCAYNLGQIVGGGHLDRARVEAEMWAAATANGLAAEEPDATRRSIRSGLESGVTQPRHPSDRTDKTRHNPFLSVLSVSSGGGDAEVWPEPDMTLLRPVRGAPPAFPGAVVFGETWAQWVDAAAEAKGAPPDYVAAALVAVAGSLIGNARWSMPWEGWEEPPILWGMLIGPPSAGKSPALDAVIDPLRALQRRLGAEAEAAHAAWGERDEAAALAASAWKEAYKAAIKAGKEPPEKPTVADPGPEPHIPRLIVDDVTIERLADLIAKQPRGTLAMRDELAGWLGNMTRYANGGSDQPTWLQVYGGRSYVAERMSRSACVDRFTVGVLGGIQPDKLSSLLLRAEDDGMLARLLPIWPDLAPIKRPEGAPDVKFAERAFERLYGLDMPRDDAGELRPCFIPFAEQARSLMVDFMRWAREEEDREAGLLVSFIGKFRGFVARLALILAHLDWAASDAPTPPTEITAAHFGRARHFVAEYLLPMARRAYAEAATPPEEGAARALARLIHQKRLEAFTVRDIIRRGRQGLRRNADVEPALNVLTQGGWIAADRQGSGSKGGRPRIVYRANPRVWERA